MKNRTSTVTVAVGLISDTLSIIFEDVLAIIKPALNLASLEPLSDS